MTSVNEGVAGISKSISDPGAALTRAQDQIAGMQARSRGLDELLESDIPEDAGTGHDNIPRELDKSDLAERTNVASDLVERTNVVSDLAERTNVAGCGNRPWMVPQ